jgi:glycosyltransferase involved in cell wall biosynthesis
LKILYIPGYRYPASLDEPLTSGDLRYSFTLSRALVKLGHDVTVISREDPGDQKYAELDGVKIHRYKSEFQKIFSTSFDISFRRNKLFKKLKRDTDAIICNSPLSLEHLVKTEQPILYIASGLEDVKNYSFTFKEVIGLVAIKLLRDPMKKLTWSKSILVNTTAWSEDSTLLKWGIPKTKIGKISSAIDSERYKPATIPKTTILARQLSIPKDNKVILSVSRFTPAKGLLETIEGFNKLKTANVTLIIVGVHHSHDSTYYTKVIEAINDSPKTSYIVLKENIPESELPTYYSLADLTSVFSVGYDPLPTVIIESMACGTPVVSTYYSTRDQFINDGVTGLYAEEKNIDDWVVKTSSLLDNRGELTKMSNDALEYVNSNFNDIEIAKKYIRMINER